jgi:DNA-binding Lrp family transcriptional regulator
MRKELPQKLLRELLKNSKRSDRDLAKILKVSQPTITRTRHKLEKSGMIQDYTIVPDFEKMGFEILAVTLIKMRPEFFAPEIFEEAKKYTQKFPNAIFTSTGEGMGMTAVILSFHHDYSDYHRKWNQMRLDWKDYLLDIQNFTVSLKEGEIKRFSLTYLKDVPL